MAGDVFRLQRTLMRTGAGTSPAEERLHRLVLRRLRGLPGSGRDVGGSRVQDSPAAQLQNLRDEASKNCFWFPSMR